MPFLANAFSANRDMEPTKKKYKYEDELMIFDHSLTNCPPAAAAEKEVKAFRWVSRPILEKNFLPPGKLNPRRVMAPRASCGLFGLSFHTTLRNSIEAFQDLEQSFLNARREIGDHVASGALKPSHGRCTAPDRRGHFDLHEYVGTALKPLFSVIQKIPPSDDNL